MFLSDSKQAFFKFGEETDEGGYDTCFKTVKVLDEHHKVKPDRRFHSTKEQSLFLLWAGNLQELDLPQLGEGDRQHKYIQTEAFKHAH